VENPSEPVSLSNRAADQSPESTTERVAKAAHAVVDEAAAKAKVVEEEIRDRAEQAGEALEETQQVASEQAEQYLKKAESFVSERPMFAAGIAFAAGVLATAMLRR
jgi:ElaB/YqjD/DUF883 family membrane-anchored ribosome-binding protein